MKTFATHSGLFHADDVAAKTIYGFAMEPKEVRVVRSRDPDKYKDADLVADVGGGNYDHHQKGGNGVRPNGVKYAAAGLVYRDFGMQAVIEILLRNFRIDPGYWNTGCDGPSAESENPAEVRDAIGLQETYDRVERTLIMPIDAADNGQQLRFPLTWDEADDVLAALHRDHERLGVTGRMGNWTDQRIEAHDVFPFSLSAAIASFNPVDDAATDEDRDGAFLGACDFFEIIFENQVLLAWKMFQAEETVRKTYEAELNPRLMLLEESVPWQEAVFKLGYEQLEYVVFQGVDGEWLVQCVPTALGSFDKRRPLPESWAGLRDAEFQAETGVEDAIFCHPGRFICGAKSREGAITLATRALGVVGGMFA